MSEPQMTLIERLRDIAESGPLVRLLSWRYIAETTKEAAIELEKYANQTKRHPIVDVRNTGGDNGGD